MLIQLRSACLTGSAEECIGSSSAHHTQLLHVLSSIHFRSGCHLHRLIIGSSYSTLTCLIFHSL